MARRSHLQCLDQLLNEHWQGWPNTAWTSSMRMELRARHGPFGRTRSMITLAMDSPLLEGTPSVESSTRPRIRSLSWSKQMKTLFTRCGDIDGCMAWWKRPRDPRFLSSRFSSREFWYISLTLILLGNAVSNAQLLMAVPFILFDTTFPVIIH